MRITKVDILHLKTNLEPGEGWRPIVCRVYTDAGVYGDGEAALAYGSAQLAAIGQLRNFARLILGMNPLDHEIIWDKLYRTTFWGQNGGPVINAGISAIDMALWDIKGKFFNVPVHQLLGGKRRTHLRCYASQLQDSWRPEVIHTCTLEDYAREAKAAVDDGYDCVKFDFFEFDFDGRCYSDLDRMGLLPQSTVNDYRARVKAVRDAVGPDVQIILENHSRTDAQSACQLAEAVKDLNIWFDEEPCTPTPRLTKYVHDRTGLPIAGGERIYTRWQYLEYFNLDALQLIQPDIGNCGGITEVKKVCDLACTFDVGVQVHVCGSPLCTTAAMQLECAIPNFVIHEHHEYALSQENIRLCIHDYQPKNGKIEVPDLPGLGNEISPWAFEHCDLYTVE